MNILVEIDVLIVEPFGLIDNERRITRTTQNM